MLSIEDSLNPCPRHSSEPPCTPTHNAQLLTSPMQQIAPEISTNFRIPSPSQEPPIHSPQSHAPSPAENLSPSITHNVRLNRKTTLCSLLHHPLGAIVEYPETSTAGPIGHLFEVSPDNWSNPRLNFAYSQGAPTGRTKSGDHVWCSLLVDGNGEKVPCLESHSTCMYSTVMVLKFRSMVSDCMQGQGCKVCPYVDIAKARQPHVKATREALKLRVIESQQGHLYGSLPHQALFEKTLSLYRTYVIHGCLGPPNESPTDANSQDDQWIDRNERARRGHEPKRSCNGQLIFDYDHNGKAFVR